MSDELNKELVCPTLVDNELDRKIKDLEDKAQKEKESIDLSLQETKIRLINEYTNKMVFHALVPRVRERDWYYTLGLGIDKKTEYGFESYKDRSKKDHRNCNYFHKMEDADKARERMLLMHRVLTIRDAINHKYRKEGRVDEYLYAIRPYFKDCDHGTPEICVEWVRFAQEAGEVPPLLRFCSREAIESFVNLVGFGDILTFVSL